jgi:hypothetical protein
MMELHAICRMQQDRCKTTAPRRCNDEVCGGVFSARFRATIGVSR